MECRVAAWWHAKRTLQIALSGGGWILAELGGRWYPTLMKFLALLALTTLLCGCAWFHKRTPPPAPPPELVITGAPAAAIVFIDGAQQGPASEVNDKPQLLNVTAGEHLVEVRVGETAVYRENIYVRSGERRIVTVLSGTSRE
jgi:hypothetical protein